MPGSQQPSQSPSVRGTGKSHHVWLITFTFFFPSSTGWQGYISMALFQVLSASPNCRAQARTNSTRQCRCAPPLFRLPQSL